MGQTATQRRHWVLQVLCRNEHVKAVCGRVAKDNGVAEVEGVIIRGRLGVGRDGMLGEEDAVGAGSNAQALGPIWPAHRMKGVVGVAVVKDRAGTHGKLAFHGNRERQGLVRPRDQVGRGGLRPLVKAAPTKQLVMAFVQ